MMSLLAKSTSRHGIGIANCLRNIFVQHACKFTSLTASRACGMMDERRLTPISFTDRTSTVSVAKYSKGPGTSYSSQFYAKSAISLKNTDNDVVHRIAEFENERIEDFLIFLETLDSRTVDLRTIEVTLKVLMCLLEKDRSWESKNIFNSVGMQKFRRTLKIQSRLLDVNVLLLNLRLFSMLKVPGDNPTFQFILKLLSKGVNGMGLPQIVYLNRLLKRLSQQSSTALAEALLQTLPIVFESQLLFRAKHSNTIVELLDFLSFAVDSKCSDAVIIKLVDNFLEKRDELGVHDALRILWSLVDRRADVDGMTTLIEYLFDLLTKNINDVDMRNLRLLLIRCSRECVHGRRSFYNGAFLDAAMNRLLQSGDQEIMLNSLKTLWATRHVNVEMLETCAEMLISNPALILNSDGLFYSILKAYADLNYKPEKWDILKTIFLNHPATTKNLTKRDLSLISNFLTLGEPPTNLLESLPSVEHLYDSKSDYLDLALIFNAMKQLFPNCNGPTPSSTTLQIWSDQMREKSKNFTYPLKQTLQSGLGGDSYVITGLVHDGIHIDHCIVLRHGGYPVFQTNLNPTSLDMIQRPPNSFLILIKVVRPNAYLWNSKRLRGSYDLEKKTLETYGHLIVIDFSEWQELNDSRKVPFIMEKIRQLTGPAPA